MCFLKCIEPTYKPQIVTKSQIVLKISTHEGKESKKQKVEGNWGQQNKLVPLSWMYVNLPKCQEEYVKEKWQGENKDIILCHLTKDIIFGGKISNKEFDLCLGMFG